MSRRFQVEEAWVSTEQAVFQGKAIIDGGATRTMASLHAMEQFMNNTQKKFGTDGVRAIDTKAEDRPAFGFGNSQKARCLSTCAVERPNKDKQFNLRVHVLGEGRAPVLLSVESLRKMGAIIGFNSDEVIFTKVAPKTLIKLERSSSGHQLPSSGHQLLPLTSDFTKEGTAMPRPVKGLRDLAFRSHEAGLTAGSKE